MSGRSSGCTPDHKKIDRRRDLAKKVIGRNQLVNDHHRK